jgi:hypothetical protein
MPINPPITDNIASTINSYQNTQTLNNGLQTGIVSNVGGTAVQGVSGLQGVTFPVSVSGNNNVVIATQVNIIKG